MAPHGHRRDRKRAGNLSRRAALVEKPCDIPFATRELHDLAVCEHDVARAAVAAADVTDEESDECPRQRRLSAQRGAQRPRQRLERRPLEEVARGAGAESGDHVFVVGRGGQHDHGGVGNEALDRASRTGCAFSEPELYRLKGELLVMQTDLGAVHAEKCFQEMIEYAQNIGWELGTIYAKNMLADLAIAQGQLDKAQDLLQTGLLVAELNKDKRRIAHYKRSFAYLRQKQGNLEEAYRWAKEAFDGFERLGMQLETEEMHVLLQELQA